MQQKGDIKKRNTITLSFRREREENTSISNDSALLLRERQRFLRETSKKGEGVVTSVSSVVSPQPEVAPVTETILPQSSEEAPRLADKKSVTHTAERRAGIQTKERKNSYPRRSGGSTDGRFRETRQRFEGQRRPWSSTNGESRRKFDTKAEDHGSKVGDHNGRSSTRSGESVHYAPQPMPAISKAGEFSSHRYYHNDKTKTFKSNSEEENSTGLAKKMVWDKKDKYSKNIHTYIFSEGEDEGGAEQHMGKFRRRDKKLTSTPISNTQKIFQTVNIPEFISVSDLAERMNEKKSDIIRKLLSMGVKATANQVIDADTAELVVLEFGHKPNRVREADVENVLATNEGTNFVVRNPVVTVMGHVDHGKTSLLDAIRTTNVVESESGGITQHIGASTVTVANNKFITFLDTPGHEAFTEMRMRGAHVTDIVVLVVAADDGIKDQTVEAIHHTKAAKVPIIVVINKMDRVGANPEKIKQDLLQHSVVAEEFGGNTMFVELSAKNKTNLDKLLEAILLQAEILDLRAPIDGRVSGAVIESKMDPQRGVITTVLVQRGTLRVGDIVVADTSYGKVRKMLDNNKKSHENASPSMVMEVFGLNTTPSAGTPFDVVSTEKEARNIISYRERKQRESSSGSKPEKTLAGMLLQVRDSGRKQLSLLLKADVSGSLEAIVNSLLRLGNDEIEVIVVHAAVGPISESDINLSRAAGAIVIAFNVRASGIVKDLASKNEVEIKYYSIIYDIVDDVKAILTGMLKPLEKEKIIGQAEVRSIFKVSNVGKVAGSFVFEGEIRRGADARLVRNGIVICNSRVKTLQRFREDVKEVKNGYEFGFTLENYEDLQEKDILECYEKIQERRN